MNYYPHHIGDFNNATRHLTRVERALYRELIELYYDTEKPLPSEDFEWICKRVLASSETEKVLVQNLLGEFFTLDGKLFRNDRCDEEIAVFKEKQQNAVRAGQASAKKRSNGKATRVQRTCNGRATDVQPTKNQEPRTKNQELTALASSAKAPSAGGPLNGNAVAYIPLNDGTEFGVSAEQFSEFERLYPAVDIKQTLNEIRGWNMSNPSRKKTRRGVLSHINSWLSKEQNRGPQGR